MPYGLKDIELEKLGEVFAANERIERVVLYGSRAKGNYKPFSDVDITLEGPELTHTDLSRLSLAIDDLLLPYQFDISIFHTLKNEALIDHIRRMGIAIYERESEWKEYRFSDFVDINPTVKIPKGIPVSFVEMKDLDSSVRYCESSQMKELSGGSRFMNGDTLFARITPCLENGKICQVRNLKDGFGFGSTEFHVLRGKEGVSDTDFVYYLSRWEEVRDHAEHNLEGSSGRQRVPKEAFDNLYLTLPSLDTQRRITSILSSKDDKIDLLHRENATLEQMAETLFRQWFVVEAKEEWEEGKLGDLIDIGSGKGLQRSDFVENGLYSVLGANGEIGKTNKYLVDESDRVIYTGRVGTLGNVFRLENKKAWLSDNTLVVRSKDYYYFVYFVLKCARLQDFNVGSTQPLIRQSDIKEIEITIPDIDRLATFEKECNNLYKKIESNNKQIQTLIQTRDGLLPRLMSGEIKI